ncbi:hypothetical protein KAR91_44905 [Candidatus Pacearchaeota archaeon]|nr:hypothetical protein [Candidatus Pacearchaeota archaeon]
MTLADMIVSEFHQREDVRILRKQIQYCRSVDMNEKACEFERRLELLYKAYRASQEAFPA